MSQSKPPSPLQPPPDRSMAETQRPPTLPHPSFLGHPERFSGSYRYNALSSQAHLGSTPCRSGPPHGYPILPPLRMHLATAPALQSHAQQAVPISKLLSDSPQVPPRREYPAVPPYSPAVVSSPPQTIVASQPYYPASRETHLPPSSRRTNSIHHPRSPTYSQGHSASSGKAITSPSHASRSPSLVSAGSYSPRHARSAISEKHERTASYSSPSPDIKYALNMRQQPIAARACGFGERDRRVVDPPPIVEVTLLDAETGLGEDDTPNVYTTLHCTVVHADNLLDASQIEQSRPDMAMTQRLMGTCVASPFPGKDEVGRKGTFFVFPDLSCRSPGRYRFLFRLIVVDPTHLVTGGSTRIQTQIYSEPFEVYSAKEFPGMRASSALLKALRKQGLNVAVKKGREATKKSTKKTHADGEDSDDDEEMAEDEDEEEEQGTERGQDKKKRKRSS